MDNLSLRCHPRIPAEPIEYTVGDNFSSIGFSLDDGSENWFSTWIESGESNGPGSGVLSISSSGLRAGHDNSKNMTTRSVTRAAYLAGAESATLSYTYSVVKRKKKGTARVQISGDGGSSWTTVGSYALSTATSGSKTFDATNYISAATQVRIEVSPSSKGEISGYLYVDNLEISYMR